MQKTNFKTRLLALLTAVFMVIMCVPFAAFAEDKTFTFAEQVEHGYVNFNKQSTFTQDYYADGSNKATSVRIMPVTIEDDYELKGWKIMIMSDAGYEEKELGTDATSIDVSSYTGIQAVGAKAIVEAKATSEPDQPAEPAVSTFDYTIQVKEHGTLPGDNTVTTTTWKNGETQNLPLPTVTVENGYELKGWNIVVSHATDVTSFSVGAGESSFSVADYTGIKMVAATAVIEKVETPAATKFDYYIQNTDKNGRVAVLGDAQVQNLTYDNGTETLPLPYEKITANDGYKFDGWKISVQPVEGSVKEFTVPAGTQSFSIKEYGELTLVGASAIFSKVETPVTYFDYTIQNASKNGKVAVLGDEQVQTVSLPSTTTVLDLPYENITANDGYVFAGWTIYVQPKNGNADKFVVAAGTKTVDVKKYGELAQAGASAIFNKVDNFTFTIQNASKNGKVEVLGDEQLQSVELPVGTKELPLPYEKITANDGYVFAGWTIYVQPKNGNADKFTVAAGTKSVDVSKYGELSLAGASAIFEEKTAETFTYAIQNTSKNGKVEVLGDEQLQSVELPVGTKELPLPYEKITANDGYVFAGWTIYVQPKNGNADKFTVKAGTKSVDVSKYGDLALAGASAIFEKKTDDNKGNTSSSNTSSSSSSSNKTTTASSKTEQKVVKAAAAPANTTKVLPKTGASNVAPLLGGSLAVVALLMGYGVYSLVLRKKD